MSSTLPLDRLLPVDADAEDGHAVVERAHDERADHCTEDRADAACRRCTADEGSGDGVQFKAGAGLGGRRVEPMP